MLSAMHVRLVSDNVFLAHECMKKLMSSKHKHGWTAVKIDMSKAYDRMS